jgi:hypothetical protein
MRWIYVFNLVFYCPCPMWLLGTLLILFSKSWVAKLIATPNICRELITSVLGWSEDQGDSLIKKSWQSLKAYSVLGTGLTLLHTVTILIQGSYIYEFNPAETENIWKTLHLYWACKDLFSYCYFLTSSV